MNTQPTPHIRRLRRRTVAGLTALLLPLGALVGLATPTQAAPTQATTQSTAGRTTSALAAAPTATYTKVSDWGTGFEGKWTVTNSGSTSLSSWTVEWDFPSGTAVTSGWDADITGAANHWTARNKSWNGTLAPGASISFGFNGTGAGAPSGCKLNGAACDGSGTPDPGTPDPGTPDPGTPDPGDPGTSGKVKLGYFTEWGVYGRNYHVNNLVTSGSAAKITHINYSFGNVVGGKCVMGDSYAAIDKAYTADQSVDGVADNWEQPLRGNFNQLRKLKAKYPHLKILWSFGGWTWSGGFTEAMQNPTAFAQSCYDLVKDPRWADVFDGIDLDWEYPNDCGLSCDSSGPAVFKTMSQAMRAKFGTGSLVTAAVTADASTGGKIDKVDYAGAAPYLDWLNVMTYDFFGAFSAQGPTAPHSPLTSYTGIPKAGFNSADAIARFKAQGVPASKLLLGIGFYGRGWTGVTQATPGGTATGAAPGTYEAGIEDYKVLKNTCPATGTIAGTAYAKCGSNWWSYDTPATITSKMAWANQQSLGGAFFWEFSGDTTNGELVTALSSGLG
ncbi:glycosyl hydrolase family 18 protein [Streptomyces sp. NPDC093109]|uniref:glycosyl hydrolase family 18 protein n=1 Tax=Streptomyces sp. NPDC093109 TaxID=3154977 RepID=UPI00344DCA2E